MCVLSSPEESAGSAVGTDSPPHPRLFSYSTTVRSLLFRPTISMNDSVFPPVTLHSARRFRWIHRLDLRSHHHFRGRGLPIHCFGNVPHLKLYHRCNTSGENCGGLVSYSSSILSALVLTCAPSRIPLPDREYQLDLPPVELQLTGEPSRTAISFPWDSS